MNAARSEVLIERFEAKIERLESGCWAWRACRDREGYGRFKAEKKVVQAHRFAYETWVGPIPDGLVVDHLCRNTSCVNPSHLEAVSNRENVLRGESFAAKRAAQDACKHGHEFTDQNTYTWTTKWNTTVRACRQCRNDAARRYKRSKAAS